MRIGFSSLVAATSLTALGLFGIESNHKKNMESIDHYSSGDLELSNQLQSTLDSLRNDNRDFVDNVIQEKENLEILNKEQSKKITELEKQGNEFSNNVNTLKQEIKELQDVVELKNEIIKRDSETISALYAETQRVEP